MAKVEVGLSAQRIYQDLVEEDGFSDSYESVKRFVRKLRTTRPERIYRSDVSPEKRCKWIFVHKRRSKDLSGKTRRNWVLSYSRKAHSGDERGYGDDPALFRKSIAPLRRLPMGKTLQEISKEAVGIHALLTRSPFGDDIPRRLLLRVSPGKSTFAPLRF